MTPPLSRVDVLAALRLSASEARDLYAAAGLAAVFRTILDRADSLPGVAPVVVLAAVEDATVEAVRLLRVDASAAS